MLLIHSDLIGEDNLLFLTLVLSTLFALLVGIGFHEACHAFMAASLGDQLPVRQGRTTLNPLAHLDPAGTVMMLFIGFGWGKPVQFNPYGLRTSPKTATLLVSAAGPLSNFLAAFILAIPIKAGWVPYINPFGSVFRVDSSAEYVGLFLTGAVYLNIILGVFNLIPLEPLDGFKVALGLLPDALAGEFAKLRRYGVGPLLLLLFVVPFLTGYSPIREIMAPVAVRLLRAFTGIG